MMFIKMIGVLVPIFTINASCCSKNIFALYTSKKINSIHCIKEGLIVDLDVHEPVN